ncbi:MAG: hypothetical protein EBT03_10290 [Betaproteobacteria bacterium]|nr:hypothetical protein [Betaproteobacteria bacterium]NCA17614.1 hypothetical protein [Betaproteobacteria bacterium]
MVDRTRRLVPAAAKFTEVFMKAGFVALMMCLLIQGVAHARPRRGYTYSTPSYSSVPAKTYSYTSNVGGSDQERCQAEADYMAANNITGHVWGCIGSFEGVGYGKSPNCNTCTPPRPMGLTGDASAQGRNGMWYRVRSWR